MKTTSTVATQKVGLDNRAYKGAPLEKRSTINRVCDDAAAYGKQPHPKHWSFKTKAQRNAEARLAAACEVSKAQRVATEEKAAAKKREVLAKMAKDAAKFSKNPAKSEVVKTEEVKPVEKVTKAQAKATAKAQATSQAMQATLDKIARREAIQAKIAAAQR